MFYKALGFVVWHVGKLVLKRKARSAASARNVAIAGVVGVAIAGLLVASRKSD